MLPAGLPGLITTCQDRTCFTVSGTIPTIRGVVVSHVGLNNEPQWADFRELDLADQDLVRQWTTGAVASEDDDGHREGGSPRRFDHPNLVRDEIISGFLDHASLDPEDDRILDEYLDHEAVPGTGITLRTLLENLGVDREEFREQLRQAQPTLPDYESIPVNPQRRRQQVRRRLAERSRSVAVRILKDLAVAGNGRELSRAAGRGNQSNLQAAISLVNQRVNELHRDRRRDAC